MKQQTQKAQTVSLPHALFALNKLEKQIKQRHPGLTIRHDPGSEQSSFEVIEENGKEKPYIIVGTKKLKEGATLKGVNARTFVMSVSHLFHEEQHCNQYEMLNYLKQNPEHISPYAKKIATERLLSSCIPEYYNGTYWTNPSEQDAERYGCSSMKQFFLENFPQIQAEGLYLATINPLPNYFAKLPVSSITDCIVKMSQDIAADKHPNNQMKLICNPETGPSKGYKELVEHQVLGKIIRAETFEEKQDILIEHLWNTHPETFRDYPYLIPPEQPQKQVSRQQSQQRMRQAEALLNNLKQSEPNTSDYNYE